MIHTSTPFAITASTSPALGPNVRRFSAWSARWRSVRTARAGRTSAAELEGLYFVAVCGNAVVAMLNTRATIIAVTEKRRVIFFPCRLLRLVETYPCMYFNPDFRASKYDSVNVCDLSLALVQKLHPVTPPVTTCR